MGERKHVARADAIRRQHPFRTPRSLQTAALKLLDILEDKKNIAIFNSPEMNPFEFYSKDVVVIGRNELRTLTTLAHEALAARPGNGYLTQAAIAAAQKVAAANLHNRTYFYVDLAKRYEEQGGEDQTVTSLCGKLAALSETFAQLAKEEVRGR